MLGGICEAVQKTGRREKRRLHIISIFHPYLHLNQYKQSCNGPSRMVQRGSRDF